MRPPTSCGFWSGMSGWTRPARARCCAARACTRRWSVSGASSVTAARSRRWARARVVAAHRSTRSSGRSRGCGPTTPGCGTSSPARPGCWRRRGNSPRCFQARSQQRRPGSQRADRPDGLHARDELSATVEHTITTLAPVVGTTAACKAIGWPRSSWYRTHRRSPAPPRSPRPRLAPRRQPRALTPAEQQQVLDTLHAGRFWDQAPASVYATLLDEGVYLCSVPTMYRLLRAAGETGDRRRHATHPARVKPELVATAPNRVWSWDITKLHGPAKWTYYYLYTILDIYSRYVVGWMVAAAEASSLAERLLADTITAQGVAADQLGVHADRGTSMTSKPVAMLLADLGVTESHPRPTCPTTTRTRKASSRR